MSSISVPDIVPAPPTQPPGTRRGLGSMRSMVISKVVILAALLVWVAMVPRVRAINQPAVDVSSVARQVRRETAWPISQPALPAGWRATSVRFAAAAGGLLTWHAGYLSPGGSYISIDQTKAATDQWVSAETAGGQAEGTLSAAGATWQRLSSRDTVQRSLVSRGSGATGLTTVLSGTATYTQLAAFADMLEPVPASAT